MEQQEKTAKKMNEITERLEKIDLRDTVKMSLRYLYKVLYSKYGNEMAKVTKILDQINEVAKILSKPEFKKFEFISKFIQVIDFDRLVLLNHVAHDSTKDNRNFSDIKKYLQTYSNEDLEYVSKFLKELPFINYFINLNLMFYHAPEKIDQEFQKKKTYSEIYAEVFKVI